MSDSWLRASSRGARALAGCALGLIAGCGDAGDGSVRVTAYGESFIEDGIPAASVDDGWAITFDRFEVAARDIVVAGAAIEVASAVDLALPSGGAGHELGVAPAAAGRHGGGRFVLGRLEVEGSATRDAVVKTFSWVFDAPTAYRDCETRTLVEDGTTGTFQITVHADHLLYDSLVADEPGLRFQALADADLDADGEVTRAELEARGIGALDPGSEGGIEDLWAWLVAATRTLGHVDGEGHCAATPLDG